MVTEGSPPPPDFFIINAKSICFLLGKGNIQRNDEIEFWVNLRCETELEVDHYFYIYGKDSIVYTDERGHLRYNFTTISLCFLDFQIV